MSDFKVGDRVQYTGNVSEAMVGKVGVVVQPPYPGSTRVFFDHGGDEPYSAYPESLTKLPAPDVITINRADLPEVRQEGDAVIIVRGKGVIYTANHNPETARASAADFLALAEFLEARQKAAEEAEHKRATRRDELARELAKKAGWTRHATAEYESLLSETQEAIDMMIDLEASHD